MHHIYHTEGIILGSRNFGETGRYYSIFTKDLGMIYASAQGVRKMSSKLRFVLQDFSYLKIDLVRGRDFWRITSVSKTSKLEGLKEAKTFAVFGNIARLLKRLLPGEEPNSALFSEFVGGLKILEECKTREEVGNVEVVIVLRLLYHLGYIGDDKTLKDFVRSPFEGELILKASKERMKILREINNALSETHL